MLAAFRMNRTDRLVAMVMFLQGRRLVRAEDLSAHFEVSVRTVYRDLAALSEAGVPISGEPGVGYSLMKSYHLPPVMLTEEEASALFIGAELARRFTDGSLQSPIEAALLKLRAVLPRDRQEYLEQLNKKTVILGSTTGAPLPPPEKTWFLPLQEAAVRRRVVQIGYRGRDQEKTTTREIEPLGVVFYGGVWYLIAWCRLRGSLRHFRLDRIQQLELREEIFAPHPEFSLARHLKTMSISEHLIPIRLWVVPCVLERLRRESYLSVVEEKAVNDGFEVSLTAYSLDWVASWLLASGGKAEALAPPELRERVRALAERTLKQYAKSQSRELDAQLA